MRKLRIFKPQRLNRSVAGNGLLFFLMGIFGVLMALPLVMIVNNALKPLDELFQYPPKLFVRNPTLDNFVDLFVAMNASWVPFSRYLLNTLIIVLITMLIATPLGVGAAVYLNEYAKPGRLVSSIEFATETLSGIPSIIFGLFGSMFFGETLGLGYSLLTGSLTLILMVLPLITRNTQEALKTVPASYRSGALGLGAGKWYMIRTVLLPSAAPGILTGAILAIGRIVGESAALLFTAGSAKALPKTLGKLFSKVFHSGGTLTIQLYLSATSEGDFDTAFGIAVVLLVLVLCINLTTKRLAARLDPRRN